MAKCNLIIELDRPDGVYMGGETISGRVRVAPHTDLECRELALSWRWEARESASRHELGSIPLFSGNWVAGREEAYPFEIATPLGPVTYHGTKLNIEHFLVARADLPLARDARCTQPYTVVPGLPEYGEEVQHYRLTDNHRRPTKAFIAFMIVLGVAMLGLSQFVPEKYLAVLIAIPCITALVWAMWNRLAEKLLGEIELHYPPAVYPNTAFPASVRWTPKRAAKLRRATARLVGLECYTVRNGKDRSTTEYKFHDHTIDISHPERVMKGEPLELHVEVPIPKDAPATLDTWNTKLIWEVEFRLDVAWLPNWSNRRRLFCKHLPRKIRQTHSMPPAPAAAPKEDLAMWFFDR